MISNGSVSRQGTGQRPFLQEPNFSQLKGELRGAHSQTNFILIYTFFHKIALLDVITAMRSFQEFTNNFSPSS